MALDTENMNVYKVETDNDIYNVVRNYDINKLFDKLIVPNATKEQLKDNLKKALNEKNNDEALRILNYLLKYKHNYYKRNDILLDDESPSSQEKTITLKDAGLYEVIFEGASAKSPWYSTINSDFEHFLVEGSPWTDNISFNLDDIERPMNSQRTLWLAKNFNYLLVLLDDNGLYNTYIGNYELNEKGAFLFKKYSALLSKDDFKSMVTTFNNFKSKTYANIESSISNIISVYNFKKDDSGELLEYFEYNSSAFAAYGTRSIFLEIQKTDLNSKINEEHKVYLRGSGDGKLDKIKNSIIFDKVSEWVNDNNKTYEQKHYYNNFKQTKNLSPTGESAYLSQVINLDSNSSLSYLLAGFDDSVDSSFKNKSSGENITIPKPKAKDVSSNLFDRNFSLDKNADKKYVGLIYGFDYDKLNLNASLNGFIGGGKKGYGPHMSHQDNCYWCNGEDAHIKIRYLGDSDAIMKRVFFPNDSHIAGKRISLVGNKSSISGFNYIDIPSNAVLEFKYKCSGAIKSLNFDKCFVTILRNSSSVYNDSYSTYGYESELDSKSVKTDDLLYKLNKTEDILFKKDIENNITLNDIYNAIGKQKWTMSELFFNNSHLIDNSEQFLDFKIDKDWNYYTISFKVFDNMILDFGSISDEVEYYNNVILENLECDCNELKSQKEYFNKSNTHNENDFIQEVTFKSELQDRIFDDNLNTLYNRNYYGTVSFNSDDSKDDNLITKINNTEREKDIKSDIFHDYRLFCEQFEKIYITIKAGNQIDLNYINLNVDFGDYDKTKTGIINNFYFKRTFFSEEELYSKRVSVKQGEFIYFKCVFNTCRVEIDRELSSMPNDTKVYPVNYDPFENKYYSINPSDYDENQTGYKGYEKGFEGTTFQWIRFTTSNSSYDLIIFLKKLTVKINFLNDLFGQDLITKNFSNNNFEPNESFSFFVKLPKECRISNYRYSNKAVYSYIEDDKTLNPEYFNEDAFESFISFFSGNSEKVIINYEDYIYSLNNILGSYSGTRPIYEIFKNVFSSISKKVSYFSDDTVIFSLEAKYANSFIRLSEDYIVGSKIFENFTGNYSNRLLNNGFYRIVGTSGNTGNGGKGGEVTPEKIYCALISGSGGGGLYGGDSGQADQNMMVSPIDFVHPILTLHFRLEVKFGFSFGMPWWVPDIGWEKTLWEMHSGPDGKWPDKNIGWWDGSKGTLGFTLYLGAGSGTGGHGFYKEGSTAGDGSWFVGVLKDVIPEENEPLSAKYFNEDKDWPLNKVFYKLDSTDRDNQANYFIKCFGSKVMGKDRPIPVGSYYLENYFNERYRGVFFDAILNINSNEKNNKIHLFSKVGSSGKNGLDGANSVMKLSGELESLPKDGICGQEGRPTTFELDNNSIYSVIKSSYFTNIKNNVIGNRDFALNKCILCGGVHDVAPQKSFKLYNGFYYRNGNQQVEIHDQLIDYIRDTKMPEHRMTKDEWENYKIDTFHWEAKYGSQFTYPKKESIFGSFAYIFYQWFWLNLKFTFQLVFGGSPVWPIDFTFADGFQYLLKCQTYDTNNISVKYRPKFLPLIWDEKTHVIYTVSDTNSALSSSDVIDDNFEDYSPTKILEIDNNSHFQLEYPFSCEPAHYVSDETLNELFNTDKDNKQVSTSTATSYGNRYSNGFKTGLFNYFECYKNFKNKSIWDNDNNIYKKSTLCVSNIGLTENLSGKGRLLSFSCKDFTPEEPTPKILPLSTNKISIVKDINYVCSFVLGSQFYELPINGFDNNLITLFNKILTTSSLNIADSNLRNTKSLTVDNINYSSEAFINQTISGNKMSVKYIPNESKVIFKNNDSFIAVYKISGLSSKNKYSVEKCCDFNTTKFVLEILDLNNNGRVIYNSSKKINDTISMDLTNKGIQILTSYNNLIIKDGNDYYVIIYDSNNNLYGVISKNKIQAPSAYDKRAYLNYFLEYPTSRGRAPLLESSFLEATFLGRDPDTLHSKDREKTRIGIIYSGFIYQNNSNAYSVENLNNTKDVTYNDLSVIDEDYYYVAVIDYEHLCSGKSILNANSTDWLKI